MVQTMVVRKTLLKKEAGLGKVPVPPERAGLEGGEGGIGEVP